MENKVLLIPGLLSNEKIFHEMLKQIEGAKVVVPQGATQEEMVNEILAAASDSFSLVGHSMGGWLALEVARKAGSRLKKLALLNTTSRSDSALKKEKRLMLIKRAKEGEFLSITEEFAKQFVFCQEWIPFVEAMFQEVGKEAFIRQELAMLNRTETVSFLPSIQCQTLVLHAEEDRNFSLDEQLELKSQIPRSRLFVVKGSGHMSPIEKSEEVALKVKGFLQKA